VKIFTNEEDDILQITNCVSYNGSSCLGPILLQLSYIMPGRHSADRVIHVMTIII